MDTSTYSPNTPQREAVLETPPTCHIIAYQALIDTPPSPPPAAAPQKQCYQACWTPHTSTSRYQVPFNLLPTAHLDVRVCWKHLLLLHLTVLPLGIGPVVCPSSADAQPTLPGFRFCWLPPPASQSALSQALKPVIRL